MKTVKTFAFLIGGISMAFAQQTDTTSVWKNQVVGNLNLTQASFSNWQQGGENSLAWQVKLDMDFERDTKKWNWSTTGKFELGFAKVAGVSARKSSDLIDLETVLTKKMSKLLNPFVSATGKSQFVAGFQYNDDDTKTKVSKFLDPGYFTQSAGVGYKPNKQFESRLGFTIKETITSDFPKPYADDPATADIEKTKIEPGLSSVTTFKRNLHENILYGTKVDIFSDFEGFNRIDLLWENRLTMKVTKYINVNVTLDLFYDKDITNDLQLKEVLGVGFTYTLL